jgi:hypothetical protein
MFNLESAIEKAKANKEEQRRQAESAHQSAIADEFAARLPGFLDLLSEALSQDLMEGLRFTFRHTTSKHSRMNVEAAFVVEGIEFTLDKKNTTNDKYSYNWTLCFCSDEDEWGDGRTFWTFDDDSLLLAIDEALNQYSLYVARVKEVKVKNAEPTPETKPVSCGSRPAASITFRQQLAADCLIKIMGDPEYPKFTDEYAADLAIDAADALIAKLDKSSSDES